MKSPTAAAEPLELGRHRLAQQHSAGRAAQRDASRVRLRTITFIDGRSVLRRQIGAIHDVLGGERNPVKGTANGALVALPRLRQRKFPVQMDPRFHLRFT
jgi:hypothetical protein